MGFIVKDRRFRPLGDIGKIFTMEGSAYSRPCVYIDEESNVIMKAFLNSVECQYYSMESFPPSHHLFIEEKEKEMTRRIIGLRVLRKALKHMGVNDTIRISDIPIMYNVERFNPIHAHIFAVVSVDYEYEVKIGFTHPEFRDVPDNEMTPEYTLEEMRKAFPYLFEGVNSNPLLWRNFGFGSSK